MPRRSAARPAPVSRVNQRRRRPASAQYGPAWRPLPGAEPIAPARVSPAGRAKPKDHAGRSGGSTVLPAQHRRCSFVRGTKVAMADGPRRTSSASGRTVRPRLRSGDGDQGPPDRPIPNTACVLGELPAVLPAHRAQQAAHVVPYAPTRLDAAERSARRSSNDSNSASQRHFDIALRIPNRLNAPRSGESRTTATLTWRQPTGLQKSPLTRVYGEVQLEY